MVTLEDLYINKHFASFSQLKERFSLPTTHFFRHLQIRNYVRHAIPNFESLPEERRVYRLLLGSPDSKHLVSTFVNVFSQEVSYSTHFLENAWEEELGIQIEADVWEESLSRIRSCSINSIGIS